jgi:hypothetical protein
MLAHFFLACLEEDSYKTINIGGLKDGVTITHMIPHAMPFIFAQKACRIITSEDFN